MLTSIYLRPKTDPMSILNWGTKWEIRRYQIMSSFCFQLALPGEPDFQSFHSLRGLVPGLNTDDRIDVAVSVYFSGAADSSPSLNLSVLRKQFSPEALFSWNMHGWKIMLGDGEALVRQKFESTHDLIFRGPLNRLVQSYSALALNFETEEASGRLVLVRTQSDGLKLRLTVDWPAVERSSSDEDDDIYDDNLSDFDYQFAGIGWQVSGENFNIATPGKFEKTFDSSIELAQVANDILDTTRVIQAYFSQSGQLVHWAVEEDGEVDFDAHFFYARTKLIKEFLKDDEVAQLIAMDFYTPLPVGVRKLAWEESSEFFGD